MEHIEGNDTPQMLLRYRPPAEGSNVRACRMHSPHARRNIGQKTVAPAFSRPLRRSIALRDIAIADVRLDVGPCDIKGGTATTL